MDYLQYVNLGSLMFADDKFDDRTSDPALATPPFLSAGSGCVRIGDHAYVIADNLNVMGVFPLDRLQVRQALATRTSRQIVHPGEAVRIVSQDIPLDDDAAHDVKLDLECTAGIVPEYYEGFRDQRLRAIMERRFPHGMIFMAGSGGVSRGGNRRSTGVMQLLGRNGEPLGFPADVPMHGLHTFLSKYIGSEPNFEGATVHRGQLVLAHRGNGVTFDGQPSSSMLVRLSLEGVLKSLFTDLRVDQCELEDMTEVVLGYLPVTVGERRYDVPLHLTDIDGVPGHPDELLVYTAAAEAADPEIRGMIAGSVVGIMDRRGNILRQVPVEDTSIKLEGVDGRMYYGDPRRLELALTADADDSAVPAPMLASLLSV